MRFMIELDRETTQALGESAHRQLRGYKQQAVFILKKSLGTIGEFVEPITPKDKPQPKESHDARIN